MPLKKKRKMVTNRALLSVWGESWEPWALLIRDASTTEA
jgi:hypothetical protein